MCFGCYQELGFPRIINAKTLRGAELVKKVYEHSCVGGSLHIVTDDWNIDDENVDWVINYQTNDQPWSFENAPKSVIETEKECAKLFREMTIDERASVLAIEAGFIDTNGAETQLMKDYLA